MSSPKPSTGSTPETLESPAKPMGRMHGAWRVRVVAPRPRWRRMGRPAFTERMVTDLIPMIERSRALAGRENRAKAGLSMGGAHTFTTALCNLDKFAYLGGSSGSRGGRGGTFDPKTGCDGAFAGPAAFNRKVKALFLGIGSAQEPAAENFSDALTKAGIHNVYFESPGTAHEWLLWGRCLNDFAPRRSVGGTATDYCIGGRIDRTLVPKRLNTIRKGGSPCCVCLSD